MTISRLNPYSNRLETHRLLAYVADLELEVDRLRKVGKVVRREVRDGLKRIEALSSNPTTLSDVQVAISDLAALMNDLNDSPGYHPAHDQVVPIAILPLVEQVHRAQQRLTGNVVELKLNLEQPYIEWFPGRFRHILDNLFSNALRYRDPVKAEAWVFVGVRIVDDAYELRVSDNGMGLPAGAGGPAFELLSSAAPIRESAGIGVGLPVVRLLLEQCGGSLTVQSEEGRGTDFVVILPRYDISDFLT